MSFLNENIIRNHKPILTKTSLQAYSVRVKRISQNKKFLCSKRMSSFLLSEVEGSMTVEAAIAIPVFLFAILNLLSIILLFGEYSADLADMHQRAKTLSVHAHVEEMNLDVGNDLIIQTKVQNLNPIISFMGFTPARTIVNCRVRKWTGYDVTKADSMDMADEWVYVTPYGESYHTSRDCRYLSLKIHSAVADEIGDYRNKDGEIYYKCESCHEGSLNGICFFTDYGNRYHTFLYCSGLKRTVNTIKMSETEGRHACAACGGE